MSDTLEHPATDTAATDGFLRSRGMLFPKKPVFIKGHMRKFLRKNTCKEKEAGAPPPVVQKDDATVEYGGGIGYLPTLVAAKRRVKSVHSFEVNPHLVPYIKSVHATNEITNAHVHQATRGPRKDSVDFYLLGPLLGASTKVLEGEIAPPAAKGAFKQIKPLVPVCDIEGARVDLVPQLELTGIRAAIIETRPRWISLEGMTKIMRTIMDAGLAHYRCGSQGNVLCFRTEW